MPVSGSNIVNFIFHTLTSLEKTGFEIEYNTVNRSNQLRKQSHEAFGKPFCFDVDIQWDISLSKMSILLFQSEDINQFHGRWSLFLSNSKFSERAKKLPERQLRVAF